MHIHGVTGVYLIECVPTGHVYVGQTRNFGRRIDHHWRQLKRGQAEVRPLMQELFNEHGSEAFYAQLVEPCLPEELLQKEKEWIRKFDFADLLNVKETKYLEDGRARYAGVTAIGGDLFEAKHHGISVGVFDNPRTAQKAYRNHVQQCGRYRRKSGVCLCC